MIFISNFNNSRDLVDIKYQFDNGETTNINILLHDFASGNTSWSVPKKAVPGDIMIFMCAKAARHNLGLATSHIPDDYGQNFLSFVVEQKKLYKQYSGCILGYGIVASTPEYDQGCNWWFSDVDNLQQFIEPVSINEFRSFISISKTNSITYISAEQWNRLKWVVDQKNPGIFPDATPPKQSVIEQEFVDEVRKASKKTIEALRKAAEKKGSADISSNTVLTKVYHRDPVIAAYVKKRAAGKCQLCNMNAPFIDKNGEPYLECHHIEWLSKGGKDAIDNCVALCPNCHRKMHLINDKSDIEN